MKITIPERNMVLLSKPLCRHIRGCRYSRRSSSPSWHSEWSGVKGGGEAPGQLCALRFLPSRPPFAHVVVVIVSAVTFGTSHIHLTGSMTNKEGGWLAGWAGQVRQLLVTAVAQQRAAEDPTVTMYAA